MQGLTNSLDNFLEEKIKDTTPDDIAKEDENTYLIQSIEDLVILSNNVNAGETYSGKTFKIVSNLNFNSRNSYIDATTTRFGDINGNGITEELLTELTTEKGFIPIGQYGDEIHCFEGNIEGNNHSIKGLYINRADIKEVGFIGLAKHMTVQNLKLENASVSGGSRDAGILLGALHDGNLMVDNIYCSGKISGKSRSRRNYR